MTNSITDSDFSAFMKLLQQEVSMRVESAQASVATTNSGSAVSAAPKKSVTSVLSLQRQQPESNKRTLGVQGM